MISDNNEEQRAKSREQGAESREQRANSQEQRAKRNRLFALRSTLSGLRSPLSALRLPRALMAVMLIALGGLAAGGYFYRDALRSTKLWRVVGLETPARPNEVYYCPMHPEYKSDKPGECPICNMTLVKLDPPAEPAAQEEHAGMSAGKPSGERRILYWQDPMHPWYKSDKPGKAPDCGMDLVPVYADEGRSGSETMPPGSVTISPAKQQMIGVTYGEVAFEPVVHTIRTVGKITYDETRIARIHAKIDGWIEKVYADFTGKLVKKGEPLLSIYSPELVATQQEYLLALKGKEFLGDSRFKEIAAGANSLFESSKKRLQLWDIPDEEIRQIEKRGEPLKTLMLYASTDGFVLTRNAFERQRVTPETELYALADLSTVWVLADIYEYEAPMIKPGQKATMTLPYFPGETLRGAVTYIYPQLDNTTRTLKIRLEIPNPDFKLKPDMFVNVELKIGYGRRISVPEEAVLDSGTEQTVFVAHEGGRFEPRKVQLGPKVDDRYIILSGLKRGERIVTSSNFLIDSESQLKSAMGAMAGMEHGGSGTPKQQKIPAGQQPHSGHQP